MAEAIRIRLTPRESRGDHPDIRREFWNSVGQEFETSTDIGKLEGKLCRELSQELRKGLISEIATPIREIERSLFDGEYRSLDHFLFRVIERPDRGFGGDASQIFETLTRHLDQRQELFRSSPEIRRLQEKMARAGSVYFSVRIAGYSSLNLDVSVSSLSALADVFDRDFDSFRVFLEAFVPQAFNQVFWHDASDLVEFSTHIPSGFAAAFSAAAIAPAISQPVPNPLSTPPSGPSSREKAEWLWKLANGSLLLPVLLALIVMYFGMSMLIEIRGTQYDALKPVLDHQLKLLEEDRLRLGGTTQPAPRPKP
ncbi:hypothetical protein PX699_02555 [Sphingobium sp. H39-3-25]|uniref:hypothetical protein n=1 Tax=Sphingobium arseniciresistens TaxID=3030834 RepID=UPI0023B93F3B|nr:hypothetical protein [Sphingobium arseniciresistens]